MSDIWAASEGLPYHDTVLQRYGTRDDYVDWAFASSRFVRRVGPVRGGRGQVFIPVRGPLGFTPNSMKRRVARYVQERAPVNTEVFVEKLQ